MRCLRAPSGWNGRRGDSSTRWSRNCGTALQRDIFAAPNVTVLAGVSPAARTTSQATRLPPQMAVSATPATAIHFSLLPNHPPSTRYGAAGIARRLQHSKLAPNPITESAADAVSGEPLVSPLV